MARKKAKAKTEEQLELDMADHASRLRSIPGAPGEMIRQVLIWLAAGILLVALGWLTLGR